jgi:hypothetical protein
MPLVGQRFFGLFIFLNFENEKNTSKELKKKKKKKKNPYDKFTIKI